MRLLLSVAAAALLTVPAAAAPAKSPAAEVQALNLAKQLIAIRSVRGDGNRTAEALAVVRDALVAGGWKPADIEIVPVDDTAYLMATWPGSAAGAKPLVLSGHMDVVEAKPADWERDPFTPVVENGYLYGRGASDMKTSAALAVAALIDMRRQGFKPRRPIILTFSGDEETTMKTTRALADRLTNAELVLNIDSGGGTLSEAAGTPQFWTWAGAEKTYVDFRMEVINPGGHSSAPRPENAIAQLAQGVERIAAYRFKPEQNPLTKAYFEQAAKFEADPALAGAMRAFAADPGDAAAAASLRASPAYVGKVSSTCVPTMISGGHAENALPQRATANVNCRIFPGHTRAEIMAELATAANVPQITFSDATGGDSTESPASPMRPDVVAAVEKGMRSAWGKIAIFPTQESGASDSMWFRAKGVPSYGISPILIKDSDDFSHGLNERVPVSNIAPGVVYYRSLFTDLAK